jgi:hypothetical protein
MTVPPIIIIILVHTPSAYQRFSCHNLKTEKKRITRCQRRQKPDLCGRALIHIWLQIKVATEGVCERAKNLQLRQRVASSRKRKFAQISDRGSSLRSDRLSWLDQEMGPKSRENRFPKTASGPESSFSLTRQAQTNHYMYDRRISSYLV